MPADKTYLDRVNVKNLTDHPITLGDLVNVTVPAGKIVDLLKQPRVTKEKINQSQHLQIALRSNLLQITRTKRKTRTANEKKASVAWEEDILDLNLNNLQEDDFLQYEDGKWVNQPPTEVDVNFNIITVTENYTATGVVDVILVDASNSRTTITLPTAVGVDGKAYHVKKIDSTSNYVDIKFTDGETGDEEDCQTITMQWNSLQFVSDGTDWFII